MEPSIKNRPVVARLTEALDHALAYASAIADNAQDDQIPLDPQSTVDILNRINRITDAIDAAHDLRR